ncbi:Uu.00g079010.m01.CDS01 [Anthostomella pinea]|uniref:Uu.00g079010.m01.CDS01 n=1 Tax=Anthostomella pinea TaxID=933095 RepID=A0AAI8VLV2_9PEZI|nr:Uu.00g079010.m01.CDS01 [Anthostomella pinea]
MEPPPLLDVGGGSFDSSKPFRGQVLCCTNIEADQRSEIAQRTADMGGVHKYDLTPDVTHLIVGDYNTAKYRHVARGRNDVKPMAAGWVDAVRALWMEDQQIDFVTLENKWTLKTFESRGGIPNSLIPEARERSRLVCCLTGFEDNDIRSMIEDKVRANGGEYVGDLSRRVTHLIVNKPEGKKYAAARKWEIRTVSIEWLHDSVERGMILNEECYDPTLPLEERGKDAWTRNQPPKIHPRKRVREGPSTAAEEGRRKLRKSASMKLNSQRDGLWGDILDQNQSADLSKSMTEHREPSAPTAPSVPVADSIAPATEDVGSMPPPRTDDLPSHREGVFAGCRFFVHGFPRPREEFVSGFLASHGGQISTSLEDVASLSHGEPRYQRYLLVPQLSQPDSHPQLPEGVHIITEFFIERCIHNKTLFSPYDHVLGQPFPHFPIDGFQDLTICSAGFRNEQLNQVEKSIVQLGAKYSEWLNAQSSLLVCSSLESVRKQKLDIATLSNIPVVNADWLWQCITTGCLVPHEKYQFKGLQAKAGSLSDKLKRKECQQLQRSRSEPALRNAKSNNKVPVPPPRGGLDMTAFDDGPIVLDADNRIIQREEAGESHYETAPTHQVESMDNAFSTAPLAEVTSNALNKSPPSPLPKTAHQARKLKRFPTGGEVGDSEGGEDLETTAQPPKETVVEDEAAERKRKEQAKAFEREEMSKRLGSLISHEEAVQMGTGLKPQPGTRPQRRKRDILGRAASNVSAASSGSTESSANAATGSMLNRLDSTQSAHSGGSGLLDGIMEPGGVDADNPPPATQLEYDNPEARRHREVMMDRMMGGNKRISGGRQSQEKVTMADYMPVEGVGTRRTTRRR